MAVKPIPDGYHSVTPYLHIRGAEEAIKFYEKAFGATENMRLPMPDGSIAHAELQIGDSRVMLSEESAAWGNLGPKTLNGTATGIMLYVPDVDAVVDRAVAAGATVKMPVVDQFYGDRSGRIEDPFGHLWMIATHIEDVPPAEMQARMDAWTASQSA